jgi:two-component system, NtrC family, sensor kinase
MDFLKDLFSNETFMPHGHCYQWLPSLLWLNVISDSLISLAYLTIPITLVYFIKKRQDLPFNWMFGAFGVFILACGTTHLLDIWTIWRPDYWQLGIVKGITAVASVITAILLVKLVPVALTIPSQMQLKHVNEALRHTNAELQRVQSELVAAARQAGMAEIAINVLHNVGNVLNSVNTSAGQVNRILHSSEARGLAKAVDLMNQHRHDLATFLTDDSAGKNFPAYLEQLSAAMATEQRSITTELEQLTKSVDHIKEIVATQQTFAGPTNVAEEVYIPDLVEDALRMNSGALERHQVDVVKTYADVPVLQLDKHRLLLILVNLMSNAKQAMEHVSNRHREMILSIAMAGDQKVRIDVRDNGEGILPENLTRIFSHGFTTRKGGHGFGLHSCALAAKEMGGSLAAQSDGADLGATFTLELPVSH